MEDLPRGGRRHDRSLGGRVRCAVRVRARSPSTRTRRPAGGDPSERPVDLAAPDRSVHSGRGGRASAIRTRGHHGGARRCACRPRLLPTRAAGSTMWPTTWCSTGGRSDRRARESTGRSEEHRDDDTADARRPATPVDHLRHRVPAGRASGELDRPAGVTAGAGSLGGPRRRRAGWRHWGSGSASPPPELARPCSSTTAGRGPTRPCPRCAASTPWAASPRRIPRASPNPRSEGSTPSTPGTTASGPCTGAPPVDHQRYGSFAEIVTGTRHAHRAASPEDLPDPTEG